MLGEVHEMSDFLKVKFELDGLDRCVEVRADELLLETLRERFDRTSVRGMCGIGVCGTCTVALDGRAVSSCLTLSAQAEGRSVTTPEGDDPEHAEIDRIQRAFLDHAAYQCSFCIPGMVATVRTALASEPSASVAELREALGGNLCRCGTYQWVLDALRAIQGETSGEGAT
jgi:aerobic-type carbon monoxide dehydrogenase small subunit (CoxS/CutS family)